MSLRNLGTEKEMGNPIAKKLILQCKKKNYFWIIQAFMFISVKPNPVNYFQPGLVRTERLDCFPSESECLSCLQWAPVFQTE